MKHPTTGGGEKDDEANTSYLSGRRTRPGGYMSAGSHVLAEPAHSHLLQSTYSAYLLPTISPLHPRLALVIRISPSQALTYQTSQLFYHLPLFVCIRLFGCNSTWISSVAWHRVSSSSPDPWLQLPGANLRAAPHGTVKQSSHNHTHNHPLAGL